VTTLSVEPGDEADVFVAVVLGEAFHKIKKKTPLAVFTKHFAAGNALAFQTTPLSSPQVRPSSITSPSFGAALLYCFIVPRNRFDFFPGDPALGKCFPIP